MIFFNNLKKINQFFLAQAPYYDSSLLSFFLLKAMSPFFIVKLAAQHEIGEIFVKKKCLISLLFFLKFHSFTLFQTLTDLTAVDFLVSRNRFKVVYNVLSISFSNRMLIYTKTNETQPLDSVIVIFDDANWLERETWDMFGVVFNKHPDLRRILTDYGFEGHPLKKDFPLTGFVEVFYSDNNKSLLYSPVSLAQEYRVFEYTLPWSA